MGLLWHSNKRYWLRAVADGFGHFVQLEALIALDGELFVVVLPGGEDKQLTAGAGVHSLATGLRQVGEAVLLQIDQRKAFLEGGPHDGFLSFRYGRRHQHSALTGCFQTGSLMGLQVGLGDAPRALHLHLQRSLQQEAVTDGREVQSAVR